MLVSAESEHHKLNNREIIFTEFQPMLSPYLNNMDGQTDNLPQQYHALRSITRLHNYEYNLM